MSAKWRRNKRHLERFSFFKTLKKVETNEVSNIKHLKIKKHTHPPIYELSKTYRERRRVEPEPLVDVLKENDEVMIIAEFVGFNRESLRTEIKNQRLTLSAKTSDRKYHKSLNLPIGVIPSSMHIEHKNGVLEIRFKRTADRKAIDKIAGLKNAT